MSLNQAIRHAVCFLFFLILMVYCYFFVDKSLTFQITEIREVYYIPLRILSILTSPATQLTIWMWLFLWYLLVRRSEKLALTYYPVIASLIASNALIRFIKIFFGRSRPDMLLNDHIYALKLLSFERVFSSLPSGHASSLASIFGLFAAKHPKHALFWIFSSVVLSLCRVFIGAHFLSDVLIGNYLGFIFTWGFYFHQSQINPAYLNYTKDQVLWRKLIASKA
jgi:membrane-associated phospholipid phosphatase